MKSFLEYVAADLRDKYGSDFSNTVIVFPNKRASLFMNSYLARDAARPVWCPTYITISDLFRNHSRLQVADDIKLVCDLHKSFAECTGLDESLDHFYGWGQLLLSDFDDIDKNMADAGKVFSNLKNYHELDDLSYLTAEQTGLLRRFFKTFSEDKNSELKRRFLELWSRFHDIYVSFNERLDRQGLAYEGALYRKVAEDETVDFKYGRYIFVGFNMLHEVERRIFRKLAGAGKARFYWDFDKYYVSRANGEHEAGHYISSYLSEFPNELDSASDEIYNNFSAGKDISYISATSENIQARYIGEWLQHAGRIGDGRRTAVVMCDEKLLKTVIHSLPDNLGCVNITTGYPLSQSPWSSLVAALMNLQTMGYSANQEKYRVQYVCSVLRHPYVHKFVTGQGPALLESLATGVRASMVPRGRLCVDEGTALLFGSLDSAFPGMPPARQIAEWVTEVIKRIALSAAEEGDTLFNEAMFRMFSLARRVAGLMASGDLVVDSVTLQRLVKQMIQSTSIPFHGEPAVGLQVMGILETRNLDFDHLLVLSCNEGNMPKGVNDTSFIPYSIRKAFGLTTIDNKVAIYSYYFYRLLQRARDITVMYNSSVGNGASGEMSRFLLQIMIESGHRINKVSLQAGLDTDRSRPAPVVKTATTLELLRKRFDKAVPRETAASCLLTPSAINRYLRCPLQFYYNYVCRIREADDAGSMDNRAFGNVFHAAAQELYGRLMRGGGLVTAGVIEAARKDTRLMLQVVDSAFAKEVFGWNGAPGTTPPKPEYSGLQLINREVIVTYLKRLLEIDLRQAPFTIIGLEKDVCEDCEVSLGDSTFTTSIGGRVDRIDRVVRDGVETVRVVDYKTGGRRMGSLPDVESVFDSGRIKDHSDYYLQALLYCMIVSRSAKASGQGCAVSPALLFIQHAAGDDYDPTLCFGKRKITDVEEFRELFEELVRRTVNEIFDASTPFVPTSDRNICRTCPYAQICGI